MLTINLIIYSSDTSKKGKDITFTHKELLSELSKSITFNIVDHTEIDKITDSCFRLVFIATGGVEQMVAQDYEKLPHPLVIMADGIDNSLASAMEIMFWAKEKGTRCELLHGKPKDIIDRLYYLNKIFETKNELSGKKIGIIGSPSPWLIASDADYLLAQRRWGVKYIDIPITDVSRHFEKISDTETAKIAAEITSKALAIRDVSPNDILRACQFYLALKQTIHDYELDAFTVSCFNINKIFETSGYLATALLNDEGITAGCEGDMQSVFSLLMAKVVTNQAGFMGNILFVDKEKDEIVIGHNSIGLKQSTQFILRNHIRSEKGITIQGIVPETEITMLKCGSESLDNYYTSDGKIVENTNYVNASRTQFRIHTTSSVTYFLNNPLGSHHIVIPGNYEKLISDFLASNSCKRVI